jgi:UDP-N-acetylmuramoyl-tripeptide--D-alanyl-D-alanine ligase
VRLTLDEIARVTGGRRTGPPELEIDGATMDSRALRPGQLFVALRDERDGHDFVGEARSAGARAVLVEREVDGLPSVVVTDTAAALTALGAHARDRLAGVVVIGVTGSVGKTSVKDLVASATAPSRRTSASLRSFNNEVGVPLTLLGSPEDTEVAVIEMGARGRSHVAELCALARPTIGVVTAVALAHTEAFGAIEEVARAKAELVESLATDGTAVLNLGDERVAAMAERTVAGVLTYGLDQGDVRAEGVVLDDHLRPRFRLVTPWGGGELDLEVRGRHNAENAAGAAAAALAAGADLDGVLEGLAAATLSPWRMELGVTPEGLRVLNDAYNANPMSMAAALEALADLGAERPTAVVGPMAELGPHTEAEHRRMGELAHRLGIRLLAVDTDQYGAHAEAVDGMEGALAALGALGPDDAVLVKASRVAGLERLAHRLLEA